MLFIGYPRCNTSNKAQKWLDDHGIKYTFRHIKEEKPTLEELKKWYMASGKPLKKMFNTSGMLYKEMKLKDRLPEMTDAEQLELLSTDGLLVKRPILITDEGSVLFGFSEEEWKRDLHL